ncbi:hypothetical protein [Modestobacter altitudinis]|uniref:hypothetical protein n=1 Tax=Modestobacter altitudinis TaxID=2213158 RepID=UPI00110D20F6|nr:hypothetical protein [Modestobacter altitudinis]
MTGAISAAALLVTLAALVSAAAALFATRRVLLTLSVLLDMLLAASLLRLALDPTPAQLAGTALLVLVKRLASSGVRRATAARAARTRSAT